MNQKQTEDLAEIRAMISDTFRGMEYKWTRNKRLEELDAKLRELFPDFFYKDENDSRLRDRIFVHKPYNVPFKKYLKEEI